MQTYLVGGSVRDILLRKHLGYDLETADRDWVVVGASPEEMIEKGFLPVGKDFPVFLHPKTREEYALARTERKTAPGYHGFVFHTASDVSLEEDLIRRDLTINAIAMTEDGALVDPYGGVNDLKSLTLRHVSEAFKEDPVRILRTARFAAKLPEFHVASETMDLMREMVQNGEADTLVAERVFQELRRALMQTRPSRFVRVLQECGLWEKLFNELAVNDRVLEWLDQSEQSHFNELQRFVLLTSQTPDFASLNAVFSRLKPPAPFSDLATLWQRQKSHFLPTPESMLALLESADCLRRPERFDLLLQLAGMILSIDTDPWTKAARAYRSVDAGNIAQHCEDKSKIAETVRQARLTAIKEVSQ